MTTRSKTKITMIWALMAAVCTLCSAVPITDTPAVRRTIRLSKETAAFTKVNIALREQTQLLKFAAGELRDLLQKAGVSATVAAGAVKDVIRGDVQELCAHVLRRTRQVQRAQSIDLSAAMRLALRQIHRCIGSAVDDRLGLAGQHRPADSPGVPQVKIRCAHAQALMPPRPQYMHDLLSQQARRTGHHDPHRHSPMRPFG